MIGQIPCQSNCQRGGNWNLCEMHDTFYVHIVNPALLPNCKLFGTFKASDKHILIGCSLLEYLETFLYSGKIILQHIEKNNRTNRFITMHIFASKAHRILAITVQLLDKHCQNEDYSDG